MSYDQPNFWKGVQAFHSYANTFADNGFYVWYVISKTGLNVQPFVAPNTTVDQFKKVSPRYDTSLCMPIFYIRRIHTYRRNRSCNPSSTN